MKNFRPFSKCGDYIYKSEQHNCISWFFKNEYWGKDWVRFFFNDTSHEQVAVEIARRYFWEEPENPNDFDFNIEVKNSFGIVKRFNVTAEPEVNFYARELESEG